MPKATRKNAADVANKWATRVGAAVPDWVAGVSAVTQAPGAAAAARKQAYIDGVTRKANKWADKVRAVSLMDWQNATVEKGRGILAERANMAKGKMQSFLESFLPVIYSARDRLPAKQKGNIEVAMSRVRGIVQAAMDYGARGQQNIKP